ncbi:putative salivary secreted peptide [Frankliniella fusca]|uniref:Salivary secreted peptide n=1 Tax=Frankliniella fusca TaxID=407009 RepID=A0AAE1LVU9_9NEOP|nr:putative salivary secreted peptide [Frankliniella fusca]
MAFTRQRILLACGAALLALLACAPPAASGVVLQPGFYPYLNASSVGVNGNPKDQSVIIGGVTWQDRLLLQETAYQESRWMRVRDADIVYPKKNELGYKISCIKVLDQRRDGLNGEVKIKEGGIGTNKVLLRFHSQRGHGLNYVVQIYGH